MTERILRRTARARTLLVVVVSICCLVMLAGFVDASPSPAAPSSALSVLASLGGLRMWAALYGAAGVAGLIVAIIGCRGTWVVLFISSLFGVWGFVYLSTWLIGLQARGYLTGTWFLTMNVLTVSLLLLPARRTCPRTGTE